LSNPSFEEIFCFLFNATAWQYDSNISGTMMINQSTEKIIRNLSTAESKPHKQMSNPYFEEIFFVFNVSRSMQINCRET
jgi:hypothetical protein